MVQCTLGNSTQPICQSSCHCPLVHPSSTPLPSGSVMTRVGAKTYHIDTHQEQGQKDQILETFSIKFFLPFKCFHHFISNHSSPACPCSSAPRCCWCSTFWGLCPFHTLTPHRWSCYSVLHNCVSLPVILVLSKILSFNKMVLLSTTNSSFCRNELVLSFLYNWSLFPSVHWPLLFNCDSAKA